MTLAGAMHVAVEREARRIAEDAPSLEAGSRPPRTAHPAPRSDADLGPGHPLDAATRDWFERKLGRDLSGVRVHTGAEAVATARALHADAFAYGPDVAFGPGRYAPSTGPGRQLLAHELTHVIQQREGPGGSGLGPGGSGPAITGVGRSFVGRFNGAAPAQAPVYQPPPPMYRPPVYRPPPTTYRPPAETPVEPGTRTGERARPEEVEFRPERAAYKPEPGSMEDFLQWLGGYRYKQAIDAAPPLATLERGPKAPPFVTVVPRPASEIRGVPKGYEGDPFLKYSIASGKRFHVLDAIEYEVARARTGRDLEQVLVNYVGYDPAFGERELLFVSPVLPGRRTVYIAFTPDFDPDRVRATVFIDALAKRPDLVTALQESKAPGVAPATAVAAAEAKEKPEKKKPIEVVLWLPSFKRPHLELYRGMLTTLQHDPAYDREVNAQSAHWDAGMHPRAGEGMDWRVYESGLGMGLSERQVLRPNWSRDIKRIPMEVDHMVELQVLPASARGWADSFVNYELLDRFSNGLSGNFLRENIRQERLRLMAATGDPTWWTRILKFTRVRVQPGPGGHRWLQDDIRYGEHLAALKRLGGEIPEREFE